MRILVVDDEQLITDTICAILNESGFDSVGVYSGAEALEAAAKYQPQIVLSDVMMPRMSGVELGIRLRSLYPETKVILFSGQTATSGLIQRAEADGHRFVLIPKPIHPRDLITRLKSLA